MVCAALGSVLPGKSQILNLVGYAVVLMMSRPGTRDIELLFTDSSMLT